MIIIITRLLSISWRGATMRLLIRLIAFGHERA